jgi:hypothetical protein
MYHAVYVSHATHEMTISELVELLKESRENNKKEDITGMLLYLQDKFIQVLEGDRKKVKALLNNIKKDSRHTKMIIILQGRSPERLFSNWSMGFKSLDQKQFRELSGFSNMDDFFSQHIVTDESHPVLIFLKHFYKKNYVDFPEHAGNII